jgi:hypothetical protein
MSGVRTLICCAMKSERPREETIVDAGFDRIKRHGVAGDKGAAVTAEIEMIVLDLALQLLQKAYSAPTPATQPLAVPPAELLKPKGALTLTLTSAQAPPTLL